VPIQIFVADKPTTNASIKKATMPGKDFPPGIIKLTAYADAVKKVSESERGISYGPRGSSDPNVKLIKTPVVNRPITLISKGRPSDDLQKFIEYVRVNGGGI
jgi:hypothetical protein